MTTKKVKKSTPTKGVRCSDHAAKEIQALAKRLMKAYPEEHKKIGINRPSSRVAIDALLYWTAFSGELNGKPINDKNNIFSAIRNISEEA